MKASELRIGNRLFSKEYNCDVFVVGILEGKIKFQIPTSLNHAYCYTKDLSELSELPLTEEWLVKLGFEKNGHVYRLKSMRIDWFEKSPLVRFMAEDDEYKMRLFGIKRPITYVHQLQNLVFALTGEELTVK